LWRFREEDAYALLSAFASTAVARGSGRRNQAF